MCLLALDGILNTLFEIFEIAWGKLVEGVLCFIMEETLAIREIISVYL